MDMDLPVGPTLSSAVGAGAGSSLRAWSVRAGIGREVDGLAAVLDETKLVLSLARGKEEPENKALEGFFRELDYEVFDVDTLVNELEDRRRIRTEVVEPWKQLLRRPSLGGRPRQTKLGCSDGTNCDVFQQNSSNTDPSASDSSELQLVTYKEEAKSLMPGVELDNKDDILRRISHHVNPLSQMQHYARKALRHEELDLLAL